MHAHKRTLHARSNECVACDENWHKLHVVTLKWLCQNTIMPRISSMILCIICGEWFILAPLSLTQLFSFYSFKLLVRSVARMSTWWNWFLKKHLFFFRYSISACNFGVKLTWNSVTIQKYSLILDEQPMAAIAKIHVSWKVSDYLLFWLTVQF